MEAGKLILLKQLLVDEMLRFVGLFGLVNIFNARHARRLNLYFQSGLNLLHRCILKANLKRKSTLVSFVEIMYFDSRPRTNRSSVFNCFRGVPEVVVVTFRLHRKYLF